PFAFAGLWETWCGPNGEEMETAAIVTTDANDTLAAIHDRMPVMLTPDAFERWLDCERVDAREAAELIAPLPDDQMELFPVSTAVNHHANDTPELIEPVEPITAPPPRPARRAAKGRPTEDDGQASLF